MMRLAIGLLFVVALAAPDAAALQPPQPKPFPQPSPPPPKPPAPSPAVPSAPAPAPRATAPGEPTDAMLGLPIYPTAQFITSYDAGRGQRFYLFGTEARFAEIVAYYRTVLKQKGELVFDTPATHMFEVGRFREESMAFPPGVTVKDYAWGGSPGYLNPKRGARPERFATIIQIVPLPAPVTR